MSETPGTPAGWYPDPSVPGQSRYWDGIAWTEHTQQAAGAAAPVAPAQQAAPAAQGAYGYAGAAAATGQPRGFTFQESIRRGIDGFAKFEGRATRSEYWYWVLFGFLVSVVASIVDAIIGIQIVGLLVALALLVPGLAVACRRLHDTDKSGWWLLIALIPFVGAIVLIVFLVQPSNPGTNQYGPLTTA